MSYSNPGHSYLHHLFSCSVAPVSLHPHSFPSVSSPSFQWMKQHGFSLSDRLLPLFNWWCFSSLPLVLRARQWTLIPDCAALPSASRCCWESMARLQDPCAHTGEKWTNERQAGRKERGTLRLFHDCHSRWSTALHTQCFWVSVIHTLNISKRRERKERKRKDDSLFVAALGANVKKEETSVTSWVPPQPLSARCYVFLTTHT